MPSGRGKPLIYRSRTSVFGIVQCVSALFMTSGQATAIALADSLRPGALRRLDLAVHKASICSHPFERHVEVLRTEPPVAAASNRPSATRVQSSQPHHGSSQLASELTSLNDLTRFHDSMSNLGLSCC